MITILTFRLTAGADEADFVAADKRLQAEFAYQQPGLMRRTTARGEDGEWVIVDVWRSAEDHDRCEAIWGQDPVTADFMTFVDGPSVRSGRYFELD